MMGIGILLTVLKLSCLYSISLAGDSDQSVSINGQTYSVMEAPLETSPVVEEEMNITLDQLNLTQLTTDLQFVSTYVRIAYNGVEEFPLIQGKVKSLAIRVTSLTDKTATTILEFERACRTVLENMQAFYQFLLLNMEDVAHEFLITIAEVAKDMAAAANRLHKEYDNEVHNVQQILSDAFTEEHLKREEIKEFNETKNNFQSYYERAKQKKAEAVEAEKKYEYYFQEARKKEEEALEEQANPFKSFVNSLTSIVSVEVFDLGAYKTAAEAAKAEKFKFLEKMEEFQSIRAEAMQDMAEFSKRIEYARDATELGKVVIESLTSAIGGLSNIAVVMLDATTFWERMRNHSTHLHKHGLHEYVKNALKARSQNKSLEDVWKSEHFKKSAVRFCAQWVALYRICKKFRSNISGVQQDLRAVIKLNPTKEEALENVINLAKEFAPQLNAAINQIESDKKRMKDKKNLISSDKEEL